MFRRHPVTILIAIIVLTVVGALFIYPNGVEKISNFRPWKLGLDLVGGSHLVYEVDMAQVNSRDRESVMDGLRDVIERRVNLFGVSEPQVFTAREGDSYRLIVELAGIQNTADAIREIGETPFLDFREVGISEENGTSTAVYLATELNGRYVKGAQLGRDQTTFEWEVLIDFNDDGAKIFEELTERNTGAPLAIFLDNQLISAPIVQGKISGGSARITGQFTQDEALQLVQRFNAGALPAPIHLVNQATVGATLGDVSLQKSIYAGALGTAIIILFMVLFYRGFGFHAGIALVIYVVLTLAVFKIIPITLTLAGIAGFILSIGMAVDANILIFERTKEELKKGLSKVSAIEEGFRRAWPSIRDSNITTMITSLILYYYTSGFVKGFGLALFVGVVLSMFSAITVTRALLRVFIKK